MKTIKYISDTEVEIDGVIFKSIEKKEQSIWEGIDPKYKWMAKDMDGTFWVYENKPFSDHTYWKCGFKGDYGRIQPPSIRLYGNWEDSLQERSGNWGTRQLQGMLDDVKSGKIDFNTDGCEEELSGKLSNTTNESNQRIIYFKGASFFYRIGDKYSDKHDLYLQTTTFSDYDYAPVDNTDFPIGTIIVTSNHDICEVILGEDCSDCIFCSSKYNNQCKAVKCSWFKRNSGTSIIIKDITKEFKKKLDSNGNLIKENSYPDCNGTGNGEGICSMCKGTEEQLLETGEKALKESSTDCGKKYCFHYTGSGFGKCCSAFSVSVSECIGNDFKYFYKKEEDKNISKDKFYIGEQIEWEDYVGDWLTGYYAGNGTVVNHIDNLELEKDSFKPVSIIKSTGLSLKTQYLTHINLLPKDLLSIEYLYITTDETGEVNLYPEEPELDDSFFCNGGEYSLCIGYTNLELAKVDWKDSCMKLSEVMVYE